MNSTLQTLSLCQRAGRLVCGFDLTRQSAVTQKARLLIACADISPKTKKELGYLSDRYGLPLVTLNATIDDLWYIIGKRAGVLGVTDSAFAEKLLSAAGSQPQALQEEQE